MVTSSQHWMTWIVKEKFNLYLHKMKFISLYFLYICCSQPILHWQCSSNLVSGWCPKRIEARAVSIILFRNEDHHTALSTWSILELANNETKYFGDNYLQSLMGTHAVVTNLLPSSVHFISRNPSCYWKEVLRTIRLNSEAKSTSHLVLLKDILPSCWVWWYDCSSALLLHRGPFESGPWNNIVSKTYVSGYHSEMLHNRPSL